MTDDAPVFAPAAMPTCFAGFLSPAECRELIAQIESAHQEQVKIWTGSGFGVDRDSRSGAIATLPVDTERQVQERLWELVPELERRFTCHVTHASAITALIYGPGDHFAAHSDGGYDDEAPAEVRRRRVSLVIALNDGARDFRGGELHFYPGCSPEHAPWAEQVVPVRSEPGLLIAFPSPMTHRVMPVREGRRYSLALWALAPE
jgi:predicted 2-oxoglutarate/Fe(II)-dependent dioxygenase YbiX